MKTEIDFFEGLCRAHYQQIYQYLTVKLRDAETARDLTQNVFAIAWEKRALVAAHENPLGFLYVTAQNLAFAQMRKNKKAPLPLKASYDPPAAMGDLGDTLLAEADAKVDERCYVNRVMKDLPKATKDLYREYYVERRSVGEIAARYGVSEVALRMRLVRLRKRVKKEAAKQNFDFL